MEIREIADIVNPAGMLYIFINILITNKTFLFIIISVIKVFSLFKCTELNVQQRNDPPRVRADVFF